MNYGVHNVTNGRFQLSDLMKVNGEQHKKKEFTLAEASIEKICSPSQRNKFRLLNSNYFQGYNFYVLCNIWFTLFCIKYMLKIIIYKFDRKNHTVTHFVCAYDVKHRNKTLKLWQITIIVNLSFCPWTNRTN